MAVGTESLLEREMNPEHGERFEQARGSQRASIDNVEAELRGELAYGGFCGRIVAADEHAGVL